jgi:hypothetical protein
MTQEEPSEGFKQLYRHEERTTQALRQVGEGYLGAAENIRAIYEGYDHGKASG